MCYLKPSEDPEGRVPVGETGTGRVTDQARISFVHTVHVPLVSCTSVGDPVDRGLSLLTDFKQFCHLNFRYSQQTTAPSMLVQFKTEDEVFKISTVSVCVRVYTSVCTCVYVCIHLCVVFMSCVYGSKTRTEEEGLPGREEQFSKVLSGTEDSSRRTGLGPWTVEGLYQTLRVVLSGRRRSLWTPPSTTTVLGLQVFRGRFSYTPNPFLSPRNLVEVPPTVPSESRTRHPSRPCHQRIWVATTTLLDGTGPLWATDVSTLIDRSCTDVLLIVGTAKNLDSGVHRHRSVLCNRNVSTYTRTSDNSDWMSKPSLPFPRACHYRRFGVSTNLRPDPPLTKRLESPCKGVDKTRGGSRDRLVGSSCFPKVQDPTPWDESDRDLGHWTW